MTNIQTFDQALANAGGLGQLHLLLGNGFSISRFPCFKYESLLDKSNFPDGSKLSSVFESQKTTDFELVMRCLDETRDLLSIYFPSQSSSISKTNAEEKKVLRDTLISTVADNHPKRSGEIEDDQYASCRKFLKLFIGDENANSQQQPTTNGSPGHIFTLNYDLLLYWALVKCEPRGNDGFLPNSNKLLWKGPNSEQGVHYLHGVLHLFEKDDTVEKIKYDIKRCFTVSCGNRAQPG